MGSKFRKEKKEENFIYLETDCKPIENYFSIHLLYNRIDIFCVLNKIGQLKQKL